MGPTEGHGYEDDINIIGTGIDEVTIATNIQKDLKNLERWATLNSLRFNPNKTKAMILSRKKRTEEPKIYLHGTEIEYVEDFKYLGVTIDNKLSWTTHMKNQVNKAQMALVTGRRMIGHRWGLHPKQVEWLYKTIVRPILTYGSIVWVQSLQRTGIRKMLDKVQRTACLMITGGMRSTPTAGMEIMIGLTPICTYIESSAISCYSRLSKTNTWRPKTGEPLWKKSHTKVVHQLTLRFPEIRQPHDKLDKKRRGTRKLTSSLLSGTALSNPGQGQVW